MLKIGRNKAKKPVKSGNVRVCTVKRTTKIIEKIIQLWLKYNKKARM